MFGFGTEIVLFFNCFLIVMRYSFLMLNANYEMLVVAEVFFKIFFTFAPITLILSAVAYITTKLVD